MKCSPLKSKPTSDSFGPEKVNITCILEEVQICWIVCSLWCRASRNAVIDVALVVGHLNQCTSGSVLQVGLRSFSASMNSDLLSLDVGNLPIYLIKRWNASLYSSGRSLSQWLKGSNSLVKTSYGSQFSVPAFLLIPVGLPHPQTRLLASNVVTLLPAQVNKNINNLGPSRNVSFRHQEKYLERWIPQ